MTDQAGPWPPTSELPDGYLETHGYREDPRWLEAQHDYIREDGDSDTGILQRRIEAAYRMEAIQREYAGSVSAVAELTAKVTCTCGQALTLTFAAPRDETDQACTACGRSWAVSWNQLAAAVIEARSQTGTPRPGPRPSPLLLARPA